VVESVSELVRELEETKDEATIELAALALAEGAPGELGAATRRYRVSWRAADGSVCEREVEDPTALLHELTGAALERGEPVRDLSVTQPSLEDIYLELTAEEAAA
jgi:ABC-2 type transport system ATP-binding protein